MRLVLSYKHGFTLLIALCTEEEVSLAAGRRSLLPSLRDTLLHLYTKSRLKITDILYNQTDAFA